MNYCWAYGYEYQGRHYEEDERDDHFYGCLGGLFFGALASFGAEGVGVDAQGLGDAGSEAIGLDESSDQRANIFISGAGGEVAECFDAGFSGAGFEIEEMEFVA